MTYFDGFTWLQSDRQSFRPFNGYAKADSYRAIAPSYRQFRILPPEVCSGGGGGKLPPNLPMAAFFPVSYIEGIPAWGKTRLWRNSDGGVSNCLAAISPPPSLPLPLPLPLPPPSPFPPYSHHAASRNI
jgi:hypothetical protein